MHARFGPNRATETLSGAFSLFTSAEKEMNYLQKQITKHLNLPENAKASQVDPKKRQLAKGTLSLRQEVILKEKNFCSVQQCGRHANRACFRWSTTADDRLRGVSSCKHTPGAILRPFIADCDCGCESLKVYFFSTALSKAHLHTVNIAFGKRAP